MRLEDVLHQDRAIDRLRRALAGGRVPHAYLFAGPDGVGKEMLATRLGALLLCSSGHGTAAREPEPAETSLFGAPEPASPQPSAPSLLLDPCGTCVDCQLSAAGNHPDFHRIHRSLVKMHPEKDVRKKKAIDLSIEVVRHFLLQCIALRPARGRAKVFVICESDRLSEGAENALLKTLEEPPGNSFLILLVPRAEAVAPTIRSRCQLIPFGALPASFVREHLQSCRGLPPDRAGLLAEISQGSLGAALRLADGGIAEQLPAILDAAQFATENPIQAGKQLAEMAKALTPEAERASDEDDVDTNALRDAQRLVLTLISVVLRDVQRAALRVAPAVLGQEPRLQRWAATTDTRRIGQAIRAIASAEDAIGRNANSNLVFDSVGVALSDALGAPVGAP